jgi:hypothetical protein
LKITPSNQTLILAGERSPLDQSAGLVGNGAALKRVTILAARPDATVVVQADYYSRDDDSYSRDVTQYSRDLAPAIESQLPAIQNNSPGALAVLGSNTATLSQPVTNSSYLSPVQFYARTQRGFDETRRAALLDVLA